MMQLQNDGQSFPYQVAEFYLVVGKNQITGIYYLLMNYSFKFDVHKKAPMRVRVWKK